MSVTSTRLDLPPLYRALRRGVSDDAFAHACRVAEDEGAGTIVWSPDAETLDFAVILEPDEPLGHARRAIYAAMAAMIDALRRDCPPEKPLEVRWPDTIVLDGGVIGGARLSWPADGAETAPPAWLVIGFQVRLRAPQKGGVGSEGHAGDSPFHVGTSLETEGYETFEGQDLIERFCRHLMAYVHDWQQGGFDAVAGVMLGAMEGRGERQASVTEVGDLVFARPAPDMPVRLNLIDALRAPQWRDAATGEPML